MKLKTSQFLRGIYQLLRNKNFEEVVAQLDGIDFESLNDEDRAYACLLYSEANLYLGNYDFSSRLQFALSFYKKSNNNANFARAKFLYGWLLISLGKHFDAREALLESYAAYKRCDMAVDQARVLNRLSFISFQVGEVNAAVKQLRHCVKLFEEHGEHAHSVIISMNLALLYYSLGRLSESHKVYQQIATDIKNQGPKNYAIYLCQYAIAHAIKGNYELGKQNLNEAGEYISNYPREQAIYHENLGWIHLIEGDYRAAEESLLKGLEISLNLAPESALVSQIKRRLGDTYLGLERYDLARKYSDEALVVAERINERVEIAACYRIYARLECLNQNEDKAKKWFKRSIDLFSMIGSQYELAATRYLAAVSGLYHNGERQALLYLAREYFESEKVTRYIEDINREIKKVQSLPMPRPVSPDDEAPVIIAVNSDMRRLVELAKHVAPSDMSVLLTGPTGSGKDLFARFIHYYSGRTGRYISVNSAAIPDDMIESELFGYKKGAYTGADKATRGWIEESDKGTFYLNELADASPKLQAKLLDVIENRRVCRLGEREERKLDFRVIAATNHDIERLIVEGRFRADLYHRLNEIGIELPALNDRIDDIPSLIKHFLNLSGVTLDGNPDDPDLALITKVLCRRWWPGNVRQLEAEIKRLALLTGGDISVMAEAATKAAHTERDRLLMTLRKTSWNKTEAAKILGLSEGGIRYRIQKHNLSPDDDS